MDVAVVVEQVQQIAAVRGDAAAGRAELEAALRAVGRLQSWLAGSKVALTSQLSAQVSFPEQTLADCTRGSTATPPGTPNAPTRCTGHRDRRPRSTTAG